MPRTSEFDKNPELLQQFAELYVTGASRADMAQVFGVHVDTITRWTGRKDVQALVAELRQRQANRILRIVNSSILEVLESEEGRKKLDLKDLLAIKKEYTPQQIEVGRRGDFDKTAADLEAWAALDAADEPLELEAGAEVVEEAEVVDE